MTKTQIRCCRARQLFGAERSRCSAGRGGRSHIAEFSTEFCPDSPLPWSPRRAKRLGSTLAVAARYRRRPGRFPAISGIRRAETQTQRGTRARPRGNRGSRLFSNPINFYIIRFERSILRATLHASRVAHEPRLHRSGPHPHPHTIWDMQS